MSDFAFAATSSETVIECSIQKSNRRTLLRDALHELLPRIQEVCIILAGPGPAATSLVKSFILRAEDVYCCGLVSNDHIDSSDMLWIEESPRLSCAICFQSGEDFGQAI